MYECLTREMCDAVLCHPLGLPTVFQLSCAELVRGPMDSTVLLSAGLPERRKIGIFYWAKVEWFCCIPLGGDSLDLGQKFFLYAKINIKVQVGLGTTSLGTWELGTWDKD
uniref:Uncharacterized protein n=1 Tax=Nelumbo nucifera TaxID=4432 RepID=A0A822Y8Y7_NELNU|nr:TPA_asm: hypothetical protein HUJ06_029499 [Nelumbo nucifera]